jgi:tight adherence protein B
MDPLVLSFLAFVAVSGLVGTVAFLLNDGGGSKNAERLDALVGRGPLGAQTSQTDMILKQAMDQVQSRTLLQRLVPKFMNLPTLFEQADVKLKPPQFVAVSLIMAGVGFFLVGAMIKIYAAPVGALVFGILPYFFLVFKRGARLKKFGNQLPDAMELVARALRAGHSLNSGLHVVSDELPAPIGKEFARVYEEQNMGITIEDALLNLSKRVPNMDLRFFVTSVAIQRQTGGDLAEILDRIGYIIRERIKILGHVKALTAEGRLSGVVLISLPIVLFLLMLQMKPDYIELLWTDDMGVKMSIGAIVLMLIGAYAIQKIVDIKV